MVYLAWETMARLEIALNVAGYMAKVVFAWVVEAGPIRPKNDLSKLPKLKVVDLDVDCEHTLGCMGNNTKRYKRPNSVDSVGLQLRQFPFAFGL